MYECPPTLCVFGYEFLVWIQAFLDVFFDCLEKGLERLFSWKRSLLALDHFPCHIYTPFKLLADQSHFMSSFFSLVQL
jgi:hypothetical protein